VFTTWILGLLRTVQCAAHAPQEFIALFALIEVSVTVGAIYSIFRRISPLEIRSAFLSPAPSGFPESSSEIPDSARIYPETGAIPSVKSIAIATIAPIAEIADASLTEERAIPAITSMPEPTASAPRQAKDSKYAKSSLPPGVRQRIKRKLQAALASESLYRNSLLNLGSLSGSIKENAHYVSQVINQELDSNFYQLVNQYRIDEAKKLLMVAPERTVLEIALSVGFNSKSTFNAAFRRNTGKTPSEYRISCS
jgi:AraC-like DNA-binding protein